MHLSSPLAALCVPVICASMVLQPAPSALQAPPDDALAQQWINAVDASRLIADVHTLAGFGTRHTLSDTTDPARGIGAARNWIKKSLESAARTSPPLEVRFEDFKLPPSVRVPTGATVVNVVAVMHGSVKESQGRAYYVVGHYDSRNTDPLDAKGDAPGANDDASGTAAVMEMARVIALRQLESTVVFLCVSGEEQGLLGAAAHAQNITATSPYQIFGVLSNDIVGDPTLRPGPQGEAAWPEGVATTADLRAAAEGPDPRSVVRVFSEGLPKNPSAEQLALIRSLSGESDSPSRQLARFVAYVAGREQLPIRPMPVFRQDRFLRGGDHIAFNDAGYAAIRFSVLNEDYTRQHVDVEIRDGKPYGDVPSYVDATYLANVTKVNIATLVHLANAPRTPANVRILAAKLDHNTDLAWNACPEPDTAGYEVVWRETTQWQWEHSVDVGKRTNVTLPINKDNVFFGVRAYDRDGYRSPVGFAGLDRTPAGK